jgi:Tfp pilus assembly protein PilF
MKTTLFFIVLLFTDICFAQSIDSYLEGMAQLKKGNYKQAEILLSNALNDTKDNYGKIIFSRGIARFEYELYNEAIDDFKDALKMGQPEAEFWLAKSYAENDEDKASIDCLKNYITTHPEMDYKSIINTPSFRKIQATENWQKFINEIQQSDEGEATASFNYYLAKNDYLSAQAIVKKMLEKNPNSAYFHSLYAKCYELEDNYSLALYEIKQAINQNSKDAAYRMLSGIYQMKLNDFLSATTSFSEVVKLKPEEFESYILLAKADLLSKNISEAKKNITIYLHYFESDTAALFLSAKINFELNDLTTCLKQLNSLFSKYTPVSEWYLLRGLSYYQTESYKLSAYDLSMCLDLSPNNKDANYFLGNSHFKMSNTSLACYYWQRAENGGDMRSFEMLQKYCDK